MYTISPNTIYFLAKHKSHFDKKIMGKLKLTFIVIMGFCALLAPHRIKENRVKSATKPKIKARK